MCGPYRNPNEMQAGGGASAVNPLESMLNRGAGPRVNYDLNRNDAMSHQVNMGDIANGVRLPDIAKPRPLR
jgi:hypothetical protein